MVHLIMDCITIVTYTVIVNGELVGMIRSKGGVETGGPSLAIPVYYLHGSTLKENATTIRAGANSRAKIKPQSSGIITSLLCTRHPFLYEKHD